MDAPDPKGKGTCWATLINIASTKKGTCTVATNELDLWTHQEEWSGVSWMLLMSDNSLRYYSMANPFFSCNGHCLLIHLNRGHARECLEFRGIELT